MNNTREPMLQFFVTNTESVALLDLYASFLAVAKQIVDMLPRNPERTVALRKLIEARDCATRAHAFKAEG